MGYNTNIETSEKFNFTYVRLGDIRHISILENSTMVMQVEMLIYKDRLSYENGANPRREIWVLHQVQFEDFAGLASNTKQMFYAIINDAISKQKDVDTFNENARTEYETLKSNYETAKEEYKALSEEEKKTTEVPIFNEELNLDSNTYAVGFGKHYDSLSVELEEGQKALNTI